MVGYKILRDVKKNFLYQNKNKSHFDIAKPIRSKVIKDNTNKEQVIWKSPPIGWLKANFDGFAKGNLGRARCGGVLRDHNSRVVDVVAIPIRLCTSHRAKVSIALFIVKKVVEIGHHNLRLEGDSLNIINMLNNNYSIMCNVEMVIRETKNILNSYEIFFTTHIFREGIRVANWISNKVVHIDKQFPWVDGICNEDNLKVLIHFDVTNAMEENIYYYYFLK